MANIRPDVLSGAGGSRRSRSALDLSGAAAEREVFVDLSRTPKRANIVREGFDIAEAKIVPTELERVIGDLRVQPKREAPRVVAQSVRPGQKVPTGSAVGLTLARTQDIPVRIFEGVHADLADRTIGDVLAQTLDREQNRTALGIVLRKQSSSELSTAERQEVTRMLNETDVTIDDATVGRDFDSAYRVLRYSSAYR